MQRYVFSQGAVRVEDEVYRPLLNTTESAGHGVVLLKMTPPTAADNPNVTDKQDKEHKINVRQDA